MGQGQDGCVSNLFLVPKKGGGQRLQSWQKLMTHEELSLMLVFMRPPPLAMLIPELRKHAVLLANSSGNNLTPIYYSVQPTLSGGKGDLQHFTRLLKVFH